MKFFNDQLVPDDLPLEDLERMLFSDHIQDFALACEELALTRRRDAFALMRRCYAQADPFRRRSLLAVLLGYPFAGELTAEAEAALASGDPELAAAALTAVAAGTVTVADAAILDSLAENAAELPAAAWQALARVAPDPAHRGKLEALRSAAPERVTPLLPGSLTAEARQTVDLPE